MSTHSLISRKVIRSALVVWGVLALALLSQAPAGAQPSSQEANLLLNGGFEWPYNQDNRSDGGGFVAHGWSAWWYNDPGNDFDAPEFKGASIEEDANRVRDGVVAQQYFKPWARHMAGLYQRVAVPAGSHVRFTVWGHAWATFCETVDDKLQCDPRNSQRGGADPITMKVGIDPTGGTDPYSSAIIWSASQAAYDNFSQFAIEADAQVDAVTVFVYSSPEWAAPVISVYWDNAVLTATAGSGRPQPTAAPGSTGGSNISGGIVTQPAREDGSQWHIVQSGESLGSIAFAYGVDVQTIQSQNNLTSNTIYAGQELLIRPASQPADPSSTTEPTQESAEPTPTPTPAAAAEQPERSANSICLRLFEDKDNNGLPAEGEASLASGQITISGAASLSGTTGSEPTCFENLLAGDYEISLEAPEGYHLTGVSHLPVTLTEGGNINLSFGAAPGSPDVGSPIDAESASQPRFSTALLLGGVALLLILVGGGGVAASLLIYRRQRSDTVSE